MHINGKEINNTLRSSGRTENGLLDGAVAVVTRQVGFDDLKGGPSGNEILEYRHDAIWIAADGDDEPPGALSVQPADQLGTCRACTSVHV